MARYRIELATPADDADLRQILAATPMPGRIAVSFRREPSYFAAAEVDGHFRQVVAGRDLDSGRLVGFGSRSIRRVYVNGLPAEVGYLSALRLLADYRNLGLLARGYTHFRKLHADGRAAIYLTTIAEGNEQALGLLTSRRAGLPAYHFAGRYHTLAVWPQKRLPPPLEVRPARPEDVRTIVEFLREHGPARQFFPCYEPADFFNTHGLLRGLRPQDLMLAWWQGRLVGTLGVWDQSDFRQTVVQGYDGPLRWMRPLVNCWAALRGRPRLPAAGQALPNRFAALPVVTNTDASGALNAAQVLCSLLHAAPRGPGYLLFGLHEGDPLLWLVRRYAVAEYVTRLYIACWEDGETSRLALDGRVPYLELGSL
jgi:hypothetical protein